MSSLYLRAFFGLAVVMLAMFGAGCGAGSTFPRMRLFERIGLVLLAGLGTLSTVLFLVGQWSFARAYIILVLLVAAVLGIVSLWLLLRTSGLTSRGLSQVPTAPASIICAVLLLTGISGLAEITGDWGVDTVAYHLLGPKVWLRDGIIRPVLDNCHTAFPQIPETLFATLWSVGGDRAPDFSSFLTLGLLLVVVASLAIRLGATDQEAWWGAAIVVTMPAVYAGSRGCFVDGIFAAFVLAGFRIGIDAQTLKEWIACGLFCGFAIGTKYTGLIAVPILLACIVLLRWRDLGLESAATKAMAAIAVACVVGSPCYIRNWILLGCPIYPPPPGYKLLCSPKYLSPQAISQFHAYIRDRGRGLGRGFSAFLLLPFNLTYHTSNFNGAGGIGLCPFALGPVGILSLRKNALMRTSVLFAFLLTLAWFITQQESRFLIHVYILGAAFSIVGWQVIASTNRKSSKYLAGMVVLLSVSYGLFMVVRADEDNIKSVFSGSYSKQMRQGTIPYLDSFNYLNREDGVRKVLILDRSVPPYYLDKDYVKPLGQWGELTLPNGETGSQAVELAINHELSVSHIFDVRSEVSEFQVRPETVGLSLVFEAKNQRVYRVE
jgi:hypothetical protein